MDHNLVLRAFNIIKRRLWKYSQRRICCRSFMICCNKCNSNYLMGFDGYILLKIFSKSRYSIKTKYISSNMDSLVIIYSLNISELDIVLEVLNRFFIIQLDNQSKSIVIKNKH